MKLGLSIGYSKAQLDLPVKLVQRADDHEATVRHRLSVYREQTRPLVDYYQRWAASGEPGAPSYRRISGVCSVEEIGARALAALS